MRVVATRPGHVGNPITVTRKGKEVGADYIHAGDEFEWEGELGKWMEPLDAPAELDRQTIITKLDAAGVKYFKGASTEKLLSLLPTE